MAVGLDPLLLERFFEEFGVFLIVEAGQDDAADIKLRFLIRQEFIFVEISRHRGLFDVETALIAAHVKEVDPFEVVERSGENEIEVGIMEDRQNIVLAIHCAIHGLKMGLHRNRQTQKPNHEIKLVMALVDETAPALFTIRSPPRVHPIIGIGGDTNPKSRNGPNGSSRFD